MARVAVTVDPLRGCRSFESWFNPRAGIPLTPNKIRAMSSGSEAKFFILLLETLKQIVLLALQSIGIYTRSHSAVLNHKIINESIIKSWISWVEKSRLGLLHLLPLTLKGRKSLERQKPWIFVRSPFVDSFFNVTVTTFSYLRLGAFGQFLHF